MALKEKILDRAQKFIQKGYIEKALIEYKAAADIDPRDISIRLRIGDLYVKMGRKPEAIKEYTEVAKANSQRGFYLKAIAVYKQVLKLDDGNLEVHYKLAELYTKQRLMADAIGAYSVIVSSFEKKGKTSEVMELLKKMIEVDPENVGVRLKLADLYQKLSFDKDALIEYAWIFNKLVTQGQFDKAEKIYLGLYHSRPREAGILEGLADLYKKRNDESQFIRFSKNLFEVYKSAGDNANASAVCWSILETRPDDSESLRFLKSISRPEPKEAPSKPIEKAEAPLLEFPQAAVEIKYEEPLKAEVAAPEQAPRAADVETPLISWPEEEIEISLEGFGEGEEQKFEEAFRREAEAKPLSEEAASPKPEEDIKETPVVTGPRPVLDEALPEEQVIEFEEIEKAIEASMPETGAKEVETGPGRALEAAEEVELKEGPEETKEDAPLIEFEEPKLEFREEAQAEEKEEPFIEPPKELEILEGISEAPKEEAAAEAPEVEISMEVEPSEDVPAEVLIEEAPVEEIEVDAQEEEMVISESPAPEADSEIIEVEGIQVETLPEADDELREDDLSSAFSELMAKMEPPEENADVSEEQALSDEKTEALETKEDENIFPEVAFVESDQPRIEDTPFAKAREGDYVDLSAELGMEEALEDLAGSWGGGGAETKDTFDEFKKGIGKQLIKEDSETHYNLGIAYMEMELYNEAAKEFKIAMKEPRLEFDCYIRLGLCAMADDNPGEAIIYYLKGLKIEGKSNEERKGMFYELALAYEAAGEMDEAFQLFKTIYDMEPGYREVAAKIKEWASERPLIPLDDGLIEVELL